MKAMEELNMNAHGILRRVLDKSIIQREININKDIINNTKIMMKKIDKPLEVLESPSPYELKESFIRLR